MPPPTSPEKGRLFKKNNKNEQSPHSPLYNNIITVVYGKNFPLPFWGGLGWGFPLSPWGKSGWGFFSQIHCPCSRWRRSKGRSSHRRVESDGRGWVAARHHRGNEHRSHRGWPLQRRLHCQPSRLALPLAAVDTAFYSRGHPRKRHQNHARQPRRTSTRTFAPSCLSTSAPSKIRLHRLQSSHAL